MDFTILSLILRQLNDTRSVMTVSLIYNGWLLPIDYSYFNDFTLDIYHDVCEFFRPQNVQNACPQPLSITTIHDWRICDPMEAVCPSEEVSRTYFPLILHEYFAAGPLRTWRCRK